MAKTRTDNNLSSWASDVDLNATEELITELQTKGKPWFKIEKGAKKYEKNFLRICPKRPSWETPYQILPVHYLGPNNQMVVCRKEAGLGECPACQLRWELENGGDKQGAQGLRPSIRTFLNAVRLNKDGSLAEEKVFLLGLNKLQFLGKQGVEYDLDEEGDLPLFYFFRKYGDLSHVETGRNLQVKAKEEKSGDYDTVHMKFEVAEPTPFPGTSELLDEELISLPEVVPAIEPAEMLGIIEGRASGAMALPSGTSEIPQAQIEAPAAEAPAKGGFVDNDDEDDDKTVVEEAAEEANVAEPEANKAPPRTDPKVAIERLQQNLRGE